MASRVLDAPGSYGQLDFSRHADSRSRGLHGGGPGTSGVGLMVTKTLVVMGDAQITTPPGRQRGAMLRAYGKANGQEVGAVWMPAPQSGSPMTYMWEGNNTSLLL